MAGLITPYATLDQLRARFLVSSSDTSDDVRLLGKLRVASQSIDRYCARTFNPVVDTRLFDWRNARSILFRGEDLLALTTLTNGDGNVIDPSALILLGGTGGPLYGVEVNVAKGSFLNYLTTKTRALSIAGIWGWHDDWNGSAWKNSNDVVTLVPLTAVASSITVTNASGADAWGLSNRFQTGQLLRIDSEYMALIGVNTGTNTLTVVRGVNGSTATTHTTGTPIYVYVPPADIVELTLRWAAWITRIEDAGEFGATGGMTADGSAGGVHVPSRIPPDVAEQLDPFRKVSGYV